MDLYRFPHGKQTHFSWRPEEVGSWSSAPRATFGSADSGANVLHHHWWVPENRERENPDPINRQTPWRNHPPFSLSLSFSTFIALEQTAGEGLQLSSLDEDAPRKVWKMNPDSQVLKVLQEAELQPLTLPLEDATICEEESSLCLQRENISGWWCKI